jgi:hypothetical protein
MVRLKAAEFLTNRRAGMSFIDFAEVKARCSIEQAAGGRSLSPHEEPLPLLSLESRRRPNCPGEPRQKRKSKGRSGLDAWSTDPRYRTVYGTVQSTSTVQDKSSPLDYLEAEHIPVEPLGSSRKTAEALGIGYVKRWVSDMRRRRLRRSPYQAPDRRTHRLHWGGRGKIVRNFTVPPWPPFPRTLLRQFEPRECGVCL